MRTRVSASALAAAVALACGCGHTPAPSGWTSTTVATLAKPASAPATTASPAQTFVSHQRPEFGGERLTVYPDGRLVERVGPLTYTGTWAKTEDDIVVGTFMEPIFGSRNGQAVQTGHRPVTRYYLLDARTGTYLWDDRLEQLIRRAATTPPTSP